MSKEDLTKAINLTLELVQQHGHAYALGYLIGVIEGFLTWDDK